jgi:hypothetical protein
MHFSAIIVTYTIFEFTNYNYSDPIHFVKSRVFLIFSPIYYKSSNIL